MMNLGDFTTSETIYVPFTTYDSNGASVTITGLAVTDIEIYKDGSVTQRASDAGYALLDTDGIDFDSTTGLHGFSVDLSDDTDSGFYAAGSQYWLVVNAITVDSQTVVFCYYFTIGRYLKPTTAGRTLDVTATGAAGIDWGNVENPTTAVDLSGTDIQLCDTVTTNTDMRGTDSAATAAELAKVPKSDGTTSWNATALASINAECDTAISDAVLATAANLATAQADLDIITGADGVVIASGTQTFNMTGNITGNLSGSVGSVTGAVGSVTGAVGSVTGNVGGNVVGTVASVVTKTGYSLVSTGLDLIMIDGKALPIAMQHIAAGVAGKISGAGTGTEVIKGLDGTTTRMTVTVDSSGNRSAITYNDA